MAENKTSSNISGNLGAGAGFLAKKFQKSMNRAQEKVLQKLGKTMETKDEQFEQCAANLNKQQTHASRLYKDVKAYHSAVRAMHETSKRLSQTLKEVYEPDWHGIEDLCVIMESEDLLWNDYGEKLNDQVVRTMENYTIQFPEVKERVAKRGRKLVDYDSARHHLESLQNGKKRDEVKISKAEEEFSRAQSVFEDINTELREELPSLYQSRISCYVTVFQNISNLRDVFYKEMSVLNHDIYNVMKKLETQHSTTPFIIKGLNSTASKKKKSLTISAPIPCNTAFPPDHPALSKLSVPEELAHRGDAAAATLTESSNSDYSGSTHSVHSAPGESDAVTHHASDGDAVERPGSELADEEEDVSEEAPDVGAEEEDEAASVAVTAPDEDQTEQEEKKDRGGGGGEETKQEEKKNGGGGEEEEMEQEEKKNGGGGEEEEMEQEEKKNGGGEEREQEEKKDGGGEETKHKEKIKKGRLSQGTNQLVDSSPPPGFLYKAVALETQDSDEGILLLFIEGDVLLVFVDEEEEKPDGTVWAIREQDWIRHRDLTLLSGIVTETLIRRIDS